MTKLKWDKITEKEYDAEVTENFFVEVVRGDVMKEEDNGGEYNVNSWYGYLWSYNKAKGRLARRRICERSTKETCMEDVEGYINRQQTQEELKEREVDMEADSQAKMNIERMAQALGIPKPKKLKKKVPVTDYSTKRMMDLD